MMTLRSEFMKSRVAHWQFFGHMRTFALPPPLWRGSYTKISLVRQKTRFFSRE